ncbi:MAG: 6,7-dimethyl-8-ribityllumazine synthase [Pseudomonadota bacterium]|nr:MAG: 6,7-dimethyl-8-ribityllumazine synthase [Pseudomonadota bacterium]
MNDPEHPELPADVRVTLVVARFNRSITDHLMAGCREALLAGGVDASRVRVLRVPGAWELPLACRMLARQGGQDVIVALGAVVRGETAHFDFISAECAAGLQRVMLDTGVPIAFGVLTTENGEQAMERADPKRRNKGREAALAALEMVALGRRLSP